MKRKGCGCSTVLIFLLVIAIIVAGIFLFVPNLAENGAKLIYKKPYQEIVSVKAEEFGVDENLVYSVMKAESKFKEEATSTAGAMGLMQITEETFEWMNDKFAGGTRENSLYAPETNIWTGTALLSVLLDEFHNIETALAAYNAGIGNVSGWLQDSKYSDDGVTLKEIPFGETRIYVKKVMKNLEIYNKLYGS